MSSISKFGCSIAAVLFLFTATSLTFKSWNLKWGNPHNPENPSSIFKIYQSKDQNYHALRCFMPNLTSSNKPHKASLELYNKDLNIVKSEALDLEYKGENLDFVDFTSLGDTHFLLSAYFNEDQKKKVLLAKALDLTTLKTRGEYTKIMEMDATHKMRAPLITTKVSPNGSMLLAFGAIWFSASKNEQYSLAVMDEDMHVLWTKNVELPYPADELTVLGYDLDDKGNVYVLASRNDLVKKKASGNLYEKTHFIFAYLNNGKEDKTYKPWMEGKQITSFIFQTMKNGDLFCAGYYTETEGFEMGEPRAKGVYSYKLNGQSGKAYENNIQEFSSEILMSDLSSKKQDKANDSGRELKEFHLQQLHMLDDGKILLVGEKIHYESGSDSKGNSQEYRHHYELLVVQLSGSGQIEWANTVDKEQKHGFPNAYFFIPTREKLHFIYKNGYRESDDYHLATISAGGKVAYADFKPEDGKIDNGIPLPFGTHSMMVWNDTKSKFKLGSVVFQ